MDSSELAIVEVLLKLDMGDARRLKFIKSKLQDGKELYDSDKKYIEYLKNRYVEGEPRDDAPKDDTSQEPQDAIPSDSKRDSNVIITNRVQQSSAVWYLVPIFLGIVGGIVAYFAVRDKDPHKAKWCIIIGALLTIVPLAILGAMAADSDIEDSIPTVIYSSEPLNTGELEQGISHLEDQKTELEQGISHLEDQKTELEQGISHLEDQKTELEQGISHLSQFPTYDCTDLDLLAMNYMSALGVLKMLDNTLTGNPPNPPTSRSDFAKVIAVDSPITRQIIKDIDGGFYDHCEPTLANIDYLADYVKNEQDKAE